MPVNAERELGLRRWLIAGAVAFVGVLVAGAGFLLSSQTTPDLETPHRAVDELLDDLANGRWESADSRFSRDCSDLSPRVLEVQFGPLMASYESHTVVPVASTDPGQDGFIRVIGSLETGDGTNSVRADVQTSVSPDGSPAWEVCGMQIYGP